MLESETFIIIQNLTPTLSTHNVEHHFHLNRKIVKSLFELDIFVGVLTGLLKVAEYIQMIGCK